MLSGKPVTPLYLKSFMKEALDRLRVGSTNLFSEIIAKGDFFFAYLLSSFQTTFHSKYCRFVYRSGIRARIARNA